MLFLQPLDRADFHAIDLAATLELSERGGARSRELLAWLQAIMNVWKLEHGGKWLPNGLLNPKARFVKATPQALADLEPWQCAPAPVESELGLFFKLWAERYEPLMEVRAKGDFMFWKALAVLIRNTRRPQDYFDARLAADLLIERHLYKAFDVKRASRRITARQLAANKSNAAQARKAPDVNSAVLRASMDKFARKYGTTHGWQKAAAIEFQLTASTISRRLRKIA